MKQFYNTFFHMVCFFRQKYELEQSLQSRN